MNEEMDLYNIPRILPILYALVPHQPLVWDLGSRCRSGLEEPGDVVQVPAWWNGHSKGLTAAA